MLLARYNYFVQKEFYYPYEDKNYLVRVTYKRSRTISYRYKDGLFIVYAPIFTSQKTIIKGLDKYADKLIEENAHLLGENEDYIYILGKKIFKKPGVILFNDGSQITFKDDVELHKKTKAWFLALITRRVRHYEQVMGTYENKVSVRDMNTRYGSNTPRNHSIRFSLVLMHFSLDVIDAIVVHELAHCFVHGHGKDFYSIVEKYYPNYKYAHKKLRKGIFNDQKN